MLFDKFCGLVERGVLPGKLGIEASLFARNAKLFVLSQDPKDFLPKDLTLLQRADQEFFLPFDCIAVEDSISCIFIRNEDENARGLKAGRLTLEVRALTALELEHVARSVQLPGHNLRDALMLIPGHIEEFSLMENQVAIKYWTPGVTIASKHSREPIAFFPSSPPDDMFRSAARNIQAAFEEVSWINSPEFFIVERTSTAARKAASGRILRSDQRPTYRILHRARAREELGLKQEGEGGRELNPHPRRAHIRTLRDERYAASGKQGKQIFVRSTWVGPSEAVVGRYRYKVLVDR